MRKKTEKLVIELKGILPDNDIENAKDMLSYGEWGEALQIICAQLVENDIKIPINLLTEIIDLSREMGVENEVKKLLNI